MQASELSETRVCAAAPEHIAGSRVVAVFGEAAVACKEAFAFAALGRHHLGGRSDRAGKNESIADMAKRLLDAHRCGLTPGPRHLCRLLVVASTAFAAKHPLSWPLNSIPAGMPLSRIQPRARGRRAWHSDSSALIPLVAITPDRDGGSSERSGSRGREGEERHGHSTRVQHHQAVVENQACGDAFLAPSDW